MRKITLEMAEKFANGEHPDMSFIEDVFNDFMDLVKEKIDGSVSIEDFFPEEVSWVRDIDDERLMFIGFIAAIGTAIMCEKDAFEYLMKKMTEKVVVYKEENEEE